MILAEYALAFVLGGVIALAIRRALVSFANWLLAEPIDPAPEPSQAPRVRTIINWNYGDAL